MNSIATTNYIVFNFPRRSEVMLTERLKNLATVGMLDYVMKSGKRGLLRSVDLRRGEWMKLVKRYIQYHGSINDPDWRTDFRYLNFFDI